MRVRSSFTLLLALVLTLVSGFSAAPAAAQDALCFPETGFCISGKIRAHWEKNGGLPVFGFPINNATNEVNRDTGQTYLTQWFQRNRFEVHPENAGTPYEVLLGRLGDDRLIQQGRPWHGLPKGDPAAPHYFPATGHAIAPQFWPYWSSHGLDLGQKGVTEQESLALFGMPISEPAMETNSSGDTVLTQWFERARFEWHPQNQPPYDVLLGLLGNEVRTPPAPPPPPVDPCPGVPDPKFAELDPGKCVEYGELLYVSVHGFEPDEQVGYWITSPNGGSIGTAETEAVDSFGEVTIVVNTFFIRPGPGIWTLVVQSPTTQHTALAYFRVVESDEN